jgi:hypothetical protein
MSIGILICKSSSYFVKFIFHVRTHGKCTSKQCVHLCRPDSRVIKLIKRFGTEVNPNQRRILCMNKVDLVEDKKDLLKVAKEFEDLPGYERFH